jgi:hypothetical protein
MVRNKMWHGPRCPSRSGVLLLLLLSIVAVPCSAAQRDGECQIVAFLPYSDDDWYVVTTACVGSGISVGDPSVDFARLLLLL